MTAAGAVVVDTSAVVAIVRREVGADQLVESLATASRRLMPTPTYVELGIVLETKLGPAATGAGSRFVRDAEIELTDLNSSMAERALEGWRRFGKGRHKAALNFGDCFVYGLASELGLPVLCVGHDFALTDVVVMSPPTH